LPQEGCTVNMALSPPTQLVPRFIFSLFHLPALKLLIYSESRGEFERTKRSERSGKRLQLFPAHFPMTRSKSVRDERWGKFQGEKKKTATDEFALYGKGEKQKDSLTGFHTKGKAKFRFGRSTGINSARHTKLGM